MGGPGGEPVRRRHRQPEREDDRKRRRSWLRRRQEGQGPQAAPSSSTRWACWSASSFTHRRHPGSRRRAGRPEDHTQALAVACAISLPTAAMPDAKLRGAPAKGRQVHNGDHQAIGQRQRLRGPCRADGSSSGPSHGWADAAGWPRTSSEPSNPHRPGSSSQTSECSPDGSRGPENTAVILIQTLKCDPSPKLANKFQPRRLQKTSALPKGKKPRMVSIDIDNVS